MKKKMFVVLLAVLAVGISCGLANKEILTKADENNEIDPGSTHKGTALHVDKQDEKKEDETDKPAPPVNQPEPPKETDKPITQWDSKKLDEDVRKQAALLNEDPNKYRMLVKEQPDGTKIYRQIGMYVIVNPLGDTVFLPDEI